MRQRQLGLHLGVPVESVLVLDSILSQPGLAPLGTPGFHPVPDWMVLQLERGRCCPSIVVPVLPLVLSLVVSVHRRSSWMPLTSLGPHHQLCSCHRVSSWHSVLSERVVPVSVPERLVRDVAPVAHLAEADCDSVQVRFVLPVVSVAMTFVYQKFFLLLVAECGSDPR